MKLLMTLVLLVGCHSHEHNHSTRGLEDLEERVKVQTDIIHANTLRLSKMDKAYKVMTEQIAYIIDDSSLELKVWSFSTRLSALDVNYQYYKKAYKAVFKDHIERIEILERTTGGRHYVLQKDLIELSDD